MGIWLWNIHLTDSRWQNEYDQTWTKMNLNNWTWPKLKLTNLMKPTNPNLTSEVLLTSVPDVFSCRGAKWRGLVRLGRCPSQYISIILMSIAIFLMFSWFQFTGLLLHLSYFRGVKLCVSVLWISVMFKP